MPTQEVKEVIDFAVFLRSLTFKLTGQNHLEFNLTEADLGLFQELCSTSDGFNKNRSLHIEIKNEYGSAEKLLLLPDAGSNGNIFWISYVIIAIFVAAFIIIYTLTNQSKKFPKNGAVGGRY